MMTTDSRANDKLRAQSLNIKKALHNSANVIPNRASRMSRKTAARSMALGENVLSIRRLISGKHATTNRTPRTTAKNISVDIATIG